MHVGFYNCIHRHAIHKNTFWHVFDIYFSTKPYNTKYIVTVIYRIQLNYPDLFLQQS